MNDVQKTFRPRRVDYVFERYRYVSDFRTSTTCKKRLIATCRIRVRNASERQWYRAWTTCKRRFNNETVDTWGIRDGNVSKRLNVSDINDVQNTFRQRRVAYVYVTKTRQNVCMGIWSWTTRKRRLTYVGGLCVRMSPFSTWKTSKRRFSSDYTMR